MDSYVPRYYYRNT